MSRVNIRIGAEGREVLRALASKEGVPMGAVLDTAIERYRREEFLEDVKVSYAALKTDPRKWREEIAERAFWGNALGDGLGEQ